MSKKASKTLIGAFVLGAVVLIVAGVVIFGGGKFFTKTQTYVAFFEGSVKGLQVGAPVTFRGVKIGQVSKIILDFNPQDMSVVIPVYIEIDPESFHAEFKAQPTPYQYYKALIDEGLKARLELQSFVTGQLMVGLDFYPDKPIHLVGRETKYHEIPTVPTTMEELAKTFEKLPLKEITQDLTNTLDGIEKLVNSPELRGSIASMNEALKEIDKMAKNINGQVGPLSASLMETSKAATGALTQAEKTLKMNEGASGEIAAGVKDTLKAATLTLDETRKTVEGVRHITAQNENIGYDINRSLEEMTALSRSLRSLTDYIDRHPEAFIRGKNPSKGE
jgi:paraquat-inducible protein B